VKRIVTILVLGGVLAIGVSSQAAASADPLAIDQCGKGGCSPIASVSAATGPTLGDLICTSPDSQIKLPQLPNPVDPLPPIYAPDWWQVTICKQ
jgi:hypothetical protein